MTRQKVPMVGQTFGRLTVLKEAGKSKNRSITYLCSCSCGNQVIAAGTALRSGCTLSCGCLKKESTSKRSMKDLTGSIINGIKVLKEVGRTKAQKVKWLCICPNCGKEFIAVGSAIISGKTKLCPQCLKKKKKEVILETVQKSSENFKEEMMGRVYGELIVIEKSKNINAKGEALWICHCQACGKNSEFSLEQLRKRKTCGCKNSCIKHGLRSHRTYMIWQGMKARCYNPNSPEYKNYGKRGISICSEWCYNFKSFYDWAITHGYEDDLTIERIDVNGNYEPLNCTWIPKSEQPNNTRRNNRFTYKDETLNIAQWAKRYDVNRYVIKEGIAIGDLEVAISRKRKERKVRKDLFLFNGKEMLLKDVCKETNLPFTLISDRIYKLNWDLDKALSTPCRKITKGKNKNI